VRDGAGRVLKDFKTTYQFIRDDETWRILSSTSHD